MDKVSKLVSMFVDILKDNLSLNTFLENFLYNHNTFLDDLWIPVRWFFVVQCRVIFIQLFQ